MKDPTAPPDNGGGKHEEDPVGADAKGGRQVQLEETRAKGRVQDDRDGEHQRHEETGAHVGFHSPRHGWITHVMTHHAVIHDTHIHLRGSFGRRTMFHCGGYHSPMGTSRFCKL